MLTHTVAPHVPARLCSVAAEPSSNAQTLVPVEDSDAAAPQNEMGRAQCDDANKADGNKSSEHAEDRTETHDSSEETEGTDEHDPSVSANNRNDDSPKASLARANLRSGGSMETRERIAADGCLDSTLLVYEDRADLLCCARWLDCSVAAPAPPTTLACTDTHLDIMWDMCCLPCGEKQVSGACFFLSLRVKSRTATSMMLNLH